MATVSSTSNFWIAHNALTITLNALGSADYVQASVTSGAVIMVYIKDLIGYDAGHNYKKFPLRAFPTVFENTREKFVYARLPNAAKIADEHALVTYSSERLDIFGNEIDEEGNVIGEEITDTRYYYILLAHISASVGENGKICPRRWLEDYTNAGKLSTDEGRKEDNEGDWAKMFSLDWITDTIHVLKPIWSAIIHSLKIGVKEKEIIDVKRSVDSDEDVPVADNNVTTSKYVDENFLSSEHDDEAHGIIDFQEGIKVEKKANFGGFKQGQKGAAIYEQNGNWHHEVDFLHVRKKFTAKEVEIEEVTHIGGQQALSATHAVFDLVEHFHDYSRCYFRKVDGDGRTIHNGWKAGDQAFTNTFNLEDGATGEAQNRYFWRLVVKVGTGGISEAYGDMKEYHWIDLSATDCDEGSDLPAAEDKVIQLGNRNAEEGRDVVMILAGAGTGSPYIRQFVNVHGYSLGEAETQLKPGDNIFKGRVHITGGTGATNLDDLPEAIRGVFKVGGENILRNTGFDGEYESMNLDASTDVLQESEMYNERLEFWTGDAHSNPSERSASHYECQLNTLSQTAPLIIGEQYILSYRCDGDVHVFLPGKPEMEKETQADGTYYVCNYFKAESSSWEFKFSGNNVSVWEVKLERGTVPTDWCPAVTDRDPVADKFRSLLYLQHAIHEGSTDIINGLILTCTILLGNYKDRVMTENTAGISGICTSGEDVAFWGGGTFDQAMRAVALFARDPTYQPTSEELNNIAKVVFTHGGRGILNDIILRGYVYAQGGVFRGTVYAEDGEFNGTVYARDGVFRGRVEAKEGYFSGVLKKNKTVITNENFKQYIIFDEILNAYRMDLIKTGTFIAFDKDFKLDEEGKELIIYLPYLEDFPAIGDYQELYDDARSIVGNTFLLYNYSSQSITFNGKFRSESDRSLRVRSIVLKHYHMLSMEAKIYDFYRTSDPGEEGEEGFAFVIPGTKPLSIKTI